MRVKRGCDHIVKGQVLAVVRAHYAVADDSAVLREVIILSAISPGNAVGVFCRYLVRTHIGVCTACTGGEKSLLLIKYHSLNGYVCAV